MKILKKILSVTIAAGMMSVMMLGCGSPKITPEESAKITFDVVLKSDKSQIDKINMSEDEYDQIRTTMEESLVKQLTSTSINLTDEEMEELKQNVLEGISKINYEIGEAEIDKDTAKVNVNIKGINVTELSKQLQSKLMEEVNADPSLAQDQDKLMKESFKLTGQLFKDAPLVEDGKDVEFTFTKDNKENIWVPEDGDFISLMSALYRI